MEAVIENENVRIAVSTFAAEIHSFCRKDKPIEYMWQGDPHYWSGRNPILFPHVMSPSSKKLLFDGEWFTVGNHGFARRSEFQVINEKKDSLLLVLTSNDKTLQEYPYRFELYVEYILRDYGVNADYRIVNCDSKTMPFGFGLHPAFNCPLDKRKSFEDYMVIFNSSEEELNGNTFYISRNIFYKYPTYHIQHLNSCSLDFTDGENGIHMEFPRFKKFALWTCEDKEADFICLEPLMQETDVNDNHTPFENRQDIIKLDPGKEYRANIIIDLI